MQNGVPEADSPIKKVAKRSRQVLDSDDDEAPAVVTKPPPNKEVKREKVKAQWFGWLCCRGHSNISTREPQRSLKRFCQAPSERENAGL